eukprot:snap_masked-scaffold_34-processed-gene-0.32-mRNA-1 protein AED:1.00 eAED:1.00 QI:0/-1/0/0/-1/1/1/0/77
MSEKLLESTSGEDMQEVFSKLSIHQVLSLPQPQKKAGAFPKLVPLNVELTPRNYSYSDTRSHVQVVELSRGKHSQKP